MRNLNVRKNILLILSALVVFMLNSCENINQTVNFETTSNKPTLRITFANNSERTVKPISNISELKEFTLSYYNNNTGIMDWDVLYSFNSFEAIQNATLDLPESFADNVPRDFRLTAKKGGLEYCATVNTRIVMGENTITFVLRPVRLGNGEGGLSYTLDYSFANDSGLVKGATAVLSDSAGKELGLQTFKASNLTDNKVVYSFNGIPAGCYTIKVSLYADEMQVALLITWYEVVQIAEDNISVGKAEVTGFNELYDITYNYNYTLPDGTEPEKSTEKISRLTNTLKIPEREGYVFLGWYTSEELNNKVSFPVSQKQEVFAKWIILKNKDDSYNASPESLDWVLSKIAPSTTSPDKPVLIHMSGRLNFDSFKIDSNGSGSISTESPMIRLALNNKRSTYVNLDFSEMEISGWYDNYANIGDYDFQNCANLIKITVPDVKYICSNAFAFSGLKEIVIPETVTSISSDAFANCPNLTDIIVSYGNNYYKSIGNVLYSKNGTILYQFPTGRPGTFTVPDEVIKIIPEAFKDAKLSEINFTENGYWRIYNQNYNLEKETNLLPKRSFTSVLGSTSLSQNTSAQNAALLKNNTENYIYHVQSLESFINPGQEQPKVYSTDSYDYSDNFTLVAIEDETDVRVFRISTEKGKVYRLNIIDSNNSTKYSNIPSDCTFMSGIVTVFSSTGEKLKSTEFTAKSNVTYLVFQIQSYYDFMQCAFRVSELHAKIDNEGLSVFSSDIPVTKVKNENTITYSTDFDADYYYWYVDGVGDDNAWYSSRNKTKTLNLQNYASGTTVLITLEVKKNDIWYSYSDQIIIE